MAQQSLLSHSRHFESAGMISSTNLDQFHSGSFPFTTSVLQQPMETRGEDVMHQALLVNPVIGSTAHDNADQTNPEEDLTHVRHAGDDAAFAANILANGSTYNSLTGTTVVDAYSVPGEGPIDHSDLYHTVVPEEAIVDDPANESDSVIRANMRAYAKLVLPDGDFYITTPKLKVVRDMDCFREYQHGLKLAKRAQRELERYAQEPSMPSQPGDGDQNAISSSKSSQSLIGRPARALPSNFSEQGGAVAYTALSDDEAGRRRRRKRKILSGKVSSTGSGSIAPASLHPNLNGIYGGGETIQEEVQVLPVHPSIPADIVKISKEHLLFAYNNTEERWELEVLGARCMVDDSQHVRGDIVPLHHDCEIMVVSLTIKFKLPDQRGHSPGISHGTFGESDDFDLKDDEDQDSDLSSVSREHTPQIGSEDLASEDEVDDEHDQGLAGGSRGKKRPKIKLKLKKHRPAHRGSSEDKDDVKEKAVKLNLKAHLKKDQSQEKLPPEVEKKLDKGKRPKTDATAVLVDNVAASPPMPQIQGGSMETKENQGQVQIQSMQTRMSPPAPPPVIEPGSIFEGVAPEEMPQKRKGPGRPPKNGLISKRDQSFVKRKIKEYEKRGELPPPMDELVSIVRAENKAKEAAQKAAARGEPVAAIMPSIEYDGHQPVLRQESDQHQRQQIQSAQTDHGDDPSTVSFDLNRRPSSPRPKHIARSPSPIKPETEFTEEEMKKPTMTYVHILDEVLKDHPIGKADLQEIYDRICKRYPYFKYKTTTSGWQSSVRHNLLQHGRFRESGRSGKGRLWAIDYNYDLSKEKKRKLTPPPRPSQQQMQHGNYASSMSGHLPPYGQPTQQTPYNHQGPNGPPQHNGGPPPPGQTPYYSPYGPANPGHSGQYAAPHGQHGYALPSGILGPPQARGSQPPHGQQAGNNGTSQSPAAQVAPPPAAFQVVVDGIMRYRERYLAPYSQNTAAFKFHEDLFKKCTAFVSDIFHGQAASVDTGSFTGEEQRVFNELSEVVNRCKAGGGTPGADSAAPPTNSGTLSASTVMAVNPAANTTVYNTLPPANIAAGTLNQGVTIPGPQLSGSSALTQGHSALSLSGTSVPAPHSESLPTRMGAGMPEQASIAISQAAIVTSTGGLVPVQPQSVGNQQPSILTNVKESSTSEELDFEFQHKLTTPSPAPAVTSTPATSSLEVSTHHPTEVDQAMKPAAMTDIPIPEEESMTGSPSVQVPGKDQTANNIVQPTAFIQGTKRPAGVSVETGTEQRKKTKLA